MRKIAIFIAASALLLLCAAPALANGIPKLPHAFYGSVTVNGDLASDGARVSATVDIGDIISTQNPVTTVGGSYGIDTLYLLVQGYDIPDGATITFYVTNEDGTAVGGTATFEAGGGPTEQDLSVLIAEPTPSPGGGITPKTKVYTDLFGEESHFYIDKDGEIQETIEATSEAGDLTIVIEEGTIALDEDGEPLESLEMAVDESPPDPPKDAHIIGLAYDFGPDGATFDPAIAMTYTLDLDDLPEGVDPEDLVIAYWDGDEWVKLDSKVDIENSTITITFEVDHFTTFAIIARAPEVIVAPPVPEEVIPPEVVPPEEVEELPPPTIPPPEPSPRIYWLWPIIGVGVFLAIFLSIRWRRRRLYR